QHEVHESLLGAELQRRVEAPLEADGGARFPAQSFAARRAPEVRGKDFDVIRQGQQPTVQAVVQLLREPSLTARSQQVGASDAAGEQCVTGQYEPRLLAPRAVRDEEAHAVRGVTRRVEDMD